MQHHEIKKHHSRPVTLSGSGDTSTQTLNGRSVLIVDDTIDNLTLFAAYLSGHGLSIDTARDAVTAVAILAAREYDFIIMDIQMPYLDGVEATKLLRKRGYDGLIIACSAIDSLRDRVLPEETPFSAYLPKPVSKLQLIDCLRSMLLEDQ